MPVTVGTDSYGDEDGLTAYAVARGVTVTGDKTVLLIKAMDYLESLRYKYYKYDSDQELQFPRNVYDEYEGDELNTVPADIIQAQYVAAMLLFAGEDLNPVVGRQTKKEKVDVIEVEYMDSASDTAYFPQLNRLLSRHLAGGFGFQLEVDRA